MSTRTDRIREASRRRRAAGREEMRRSILEAAGELFQEHGYEDFSLRQVAERIGYAPTAIYRHFGNKDDLLAAIAQGGFEKLRVALEWASGGVADPVERIEALGWAYIRFGTTHSVPYQLMFMQRHDLLLRSGPGQPPQENAEETPAPAFEVLGRAVAHALATGALRGSDVAATSQALWALVHGLTSLAIIRSKVFDNDQLEATARLAMSAMLAGLRSD